MNNTKDAGAVGGKKQTQLRTLFVSGLRNGFTLLRSRSGLQGLKLGTQEWLQVGSRALGCAAFVCEQQCALRRGHVPAPAGKPLARPRGRKSSRFAANQPVPWGSVLAEEQRGRSSCSSARR